MSQLLKLISQAERRNDTRQLERLAKYSFEQWLYYANLVPVIFMYKLADNEENKKRGRANRNSGYRQGVRNLAFVPANKQPKSFNPDKRTYRYYELTKANWRSFRPGNFLVISAFWSEELGKFVDTPEEAGIEPGQPFEPKTKSTPDTDGSREKRAAEREAKKREREQERKQTKRNEAIRRAKKERRQTKIKSRVK